MDSRFLVKNSQGIIKTLAKYPSIGTFSSFYHFKKLTKYAFWLWKRICYRYLTFMKEGIIL